MFVLLLCFADLFIVALSHSVSRFEGGVPVTIIGEFGDNQDVNEVYFGSALATIVSQTPTVRRFETRSTQYGNVRSAGCVVVLFLIGCCRLL